MDNCDHRVAEVALLVDQLPDPHKRMVEILCCHLEKVAAKSYKNLMTVENLGVCFGPTLLRDEEETIEAIMDISFANAVVVILVENWKKDPDSDEVSNDNPEPDKNDKQSPILKEETDFVVEDAVRRVRSSKYNRQDSAYIKVFTEKDFDSLKFDFSNSKSTDPCILKVKLSTYGIRGISMEYSWHMKGNILLISLSTILSQISNPHVSNM